MILLLVFLLMSSAVLSQDTVCKPRPAWSACPATPECDGILRKWYSQGCLGKGGRKLLDGGCQCQGYCGYKCASACKADPECTWNAAKKACFNTATNLPGKAITACTATRNPTVAPTNSPTTSPSLPPSKAPTIPTRSPTSAPSPAPTKSLCHRDGKFPGAPFTTSKFTQSTEAFGISTDGRSVAFYTGYHEYETGSHNEIWVTTQNKATGEWKPQRVVEYVAADDDYDDRTFPQATLSGNGNFLFVVAGESRNTAANNCSFYKRQANGKFTLQTRLPVAGRMEQPQKLWISAAGDRAAVSYYKRELGEQHSTPVTVNFARSNGAWSIEWTQQNLSIKSVSPDGNTALVVSSNSRFVYIRQGKQWVKQSGDLVGTGLQGFYQGSDASSFAPDGNTLVIGSLAMYDDDYEPDWAPEDSGAWVFVRSNGNWTQQGPKLGGGNTHDGYFTGISDDKKTIMVSWGQRPYGFYIFKKTGQTYTQVGKVTANSKDPIMSRDGKRLVTNAHSPEWTAFLWKC